MIFIFRKIRQKLLQKNRITRYLVYALGEILLVVFGILIALWVSTWNQLKLNEEREERILTGLLAEFETASTELKADLAARERQYIATARLRDFHLANRPLPISKDSIQAIFTNVISTRFYSTGHPILNDLASSGGLELIKSDSIRQLLSTYLQDKSRYIAVEEREGDFVYDQLIPVLSDFVDLGKVQTGIIDSSELQKIFLSQKKNARYGSVLHLRLNRIRISKDYGNNVLATIEDIIDVLSQELNSRR